MYKWRQQEGKITLRCGGCKIFFYCGKDCQEEHWKKTHRQHCKHLSKLKEEYNSQQDLDSDLQLLSSVTRDPIDLVERVIRVMQGLLVKIKLSKHSVTEIVEVEKLLDDLEETRAKIYVQRLLNPKELHLSKMFTFPEISKGNKNLKTWEILNVLRWLLLQLSLIRLDQVLKSPEKSLPTKWRETSRRVREGPFLMIVEKILEALERQVILQSELANIACEGKLKQNCTVCQKEITVTGIWSPLEVGDTVPLAASVRLYILDACVITFSCGSAECEASHRLSHMAWSSVLFSTFAKLKPARCDHCFLCAPLEEVHRSLCKTNN